jgi:hypothetical protein
MMETIFTTTPLTGFPFQTPIAFGNRPLATPVFGSSTMPGFAGTISTNAQGIPTGSLPVSMYGYGGGMTPQGIPGSNFAGALPFGPHPPAVIVGETAGITAPALLAAVAMRRGQPQGPTNDHEVEDFIYDAFELLPGASDVEVRCEGGRVTLTGNVQHKRVKRDVGEVAWAIPALIDVQNNVTITSRRKARAGGREAEPPAGGASRKQG